MTRCLREKEVISYYLGEGAQAHQAHVNACATCASRVGQLAHDLGLIESALKAPPEPAVSRRAVPAGLYRAGLRWALVATAVVLAFVGGQITGYRPLGHKITPAISPSTGREASAIPAASPNQATLEMAGLENAPSSPAMYGLYIQEELTPGASPGGDFLSSFEDVDFVEP